MVFDAKRMKKLVAKDSYLKFMYKDLKAKNKKESAEYVLKVLFNANVRGRSDYRDIY